MGYKWDFLNKPTYYKIKVVILTPGCNVHLDIKSKTLPHKFKVLKKLEDGEEEEKEYTVKLEDLWEIKYIFLKRPLYWVMGIKGRYLCLFRSNEAGDPIKTVKTKATPTLIRNVKRSRILKKALAEVFKMGMGGFGKFIIITGATLIAVYLAYTQGLIG